MGQASCSFCSRGRITPSIAAISDDFCLSPVPNFSMGFTALFFVLLIASRFIMYGRFGKTAFLRRERFVTPLAGICLETINNIKEKMRSRTLSLSSMSRESSSYTSLWVSWVKVPLFFVFSIMAMVLYVVVYYISLLYSVIFTSLILWRSISSAFRLPPLLDIISNALKSLAHSLGIPGWILSYLLLPATYLIGVLSNFQLDLAGLNVTCNGAKAPIELLINCFILSFFVVFVKSEYFLLWNVSFQNLNQSYVDRHLSSQDKFHSVRAFLNRWGNEFWEEVGSLSVALETVLIINPVESLHRISKVLFVVIVVYPLQLLFTLFVVYPLRSVPSLLVAFPFLAVMGVFAMNPLQSLLKYSFTLAHISAFVADNGMHPLSPACDNVSGYPMFDTILGVSSSVIAWLLVLPIIYLLSDVLVPGKLPQHAHIYDAFAAAAAQEINEQPNQVTETTPTSASYHNNERHRNTAASSWNRSMVVYFKDKVASFLSFDIWLIGGFASMWARYLQKANRRERKRRLSSVFVADSILQFRDKASIDTALNSSPFLQQRRSAFNYSVSTALEKDEQLSLLWAECKQNQLPSYARLCRHTHDELIKSLERYEFPLGIVFCGPLSGLGVGHLLTVRGRQCWGIVAKKYWMFLQVCCGIWTDDAFMAFEIRRVSKSMLPVDDDQGMPMILGSIVGPRALLFLAFDYGGLLTTLVLSTCATPLFVISDQLKRRDGKAVFPDLLFSFNRAQEVARDREAGEVGLDSLSKWVVLLRTLLIMRTESLLVGFTVNIIIFAICVIFLFSGGQGVSLVLLLSLLLAPFATASSLALVIYVGRLLGLKDSDFVTFVSVIAPLLLRRWWKEEEGSMLGSRVSVEEESNYPATRQQSSVWVVDPGFEVHEDSSNECSSMYNSIPEEKSSKERSNHSSNRGDDKNIAAVSRSCHDNEEDSGSSLDTYLTIDFDDLSVAQSGPNASQDEMDEDDRQFHAKAICYDFSSSIPEEKRNKEWNNNRSNHSSNRGDDKNITAVTRSCHDNEEDSGSSLDTYLTIDFDDLSVAQSGPNASQDEMDEENRQILW